MPSPTEQLTPDSTDKEINDAIGACIEMEAKAHPEWSSDQRVAACFSMARKATGKNLGKE